MADSPDRLIIQGIQEDGKKLRPTDWIERISSSLATLDESHRLHYLSSVQPCVIDGEKCLVVARCLEQTNPAAYHFIMDFAQTNKLRIQLDRREGARALPCPVPSAL